MLAALAAGEAPPPADEPPSAELLLFLAEFGDDEGRFVDPTTIDAQPAADRDAAPADDGDDTDDDATHDPPL